MLLFKRQAPLPATFLVSKKRIQT